MKIPTFKDIQEAYDRISPYIHCTPVLTSSSLNRILGAECYFKCENFQKVGAFKFRGATNAVFSLSDEAALMGVATHSSGNHAAALALAAQIRGIKAHIVMPNNAPKVKQEAVASYGAEITFCEPTLEARETTLQEVVKKTGATFIHPYNNFHVIAGQGTVALELLKEIPHPDFLLTPVGGGGLLSGTALTTKALSPETLIIAGEPKGADDAWQSLKAGCLIPVSETNTIADGLLTSLGPLTFEIINSNVHDILTVSEASIIAAMELIWQRMKIIIEPSSAVPVAAILENRQLFRGKKLGVILSGGNVDLEHLPFKEFQLQKNIQDIK